MAKLLLDRYLADILRLAESLQTLLRAEGLQEADHIKLYATLHRVNSITWRALQEAEFELEQAEREQSG